MTWTHVARQDGRQLLEARAVRLLLYLLALIVLLAAYLYPMMVPETEPVTTARFPGFVTGWLTTIVPLLGIVLGYNAIVGDRESGAIYLSLSMPVSRETLVFGTYVGRVGLLTAALVGLLGAAAGLVVYPFGDLVLLRYLGFVLLTVVFGAIWVGIGVAVSVSVATKQRAFALGFGIFALFVFAWDAMPAALEFALARYGLVGDSLPSQAQFLFDLDPGVLYDRLTTAFVIPGESVDGPWYRSEWMALVLFGLWAVLPLGLATRLFAERDLS